MSLPQLTLLTACGSLIAAIWYCKNVIKYVKKEQGQSQIDKNIISSGEDTTGGGSGFNDLSKIDDWFPVNELTPTRLKTIKY